MKAIDKEIKKTESRIDIAIKTAETIRDIIKNQRKADMGAVLGIIEKKECGNCNAIGDKINRTTCKGCNAYDSIKAIKSYYGGVV